MVERTLVIPQEFTASMKFFMDQMNKMMDLTKKMQATVPRLPQPADHSSVAYKFQYLNQVLTRTETNLSRTVSKLTTDLGPLGRSLLSTFDVQGLLARIPVLSETALLRFAGPAAFALAPVIVVVETIKFLITKTFTLAGPSFRDFMAAMGFGTDVAGLRAFGLMFGPLGISLTGMTRGQFDIASTEFTALNALNIKRSLDSADTMASGIVAATRLLRTLPRQNVMPMARAIGLLSLLSEENIVALLTMSEKELQERADQYAKHKRAFKLPPDTLQKFNVLYRAMQNFVLTTETLLIKRLTPLTAAGTKLSDAATKFGASLLHAFGVLNAAWIKKVRSFITTFTQFLHDAIRALQSFGVWLKQPLIGQPTGGALFRPGIGPRARHGVKPGGPLFRPGVGPGAARGAAGGAAGNIKLPGGAREDPRQLEQYIRETAKKYGIDPNTAVTVARSEGLSSFYGDHKTSFGAFQLHVTRGGGAVGDNFRRDTGLDPSDPKNERATIDYALRHARKHGWGAWMGAQGRGITGFTGVDRNAPAPPAPSYKAPAPTATAPKAAAPATPRPEAPPSTAPASAAGFKYPTEAELTDKSRRAGERFNNPYNMWYDKYARDVYGLPGRQITQYDTPAIFPSKVLGASASIRKMAESPLYSGKSMQDLIKTWVGHGESYAPIIEKETGISKDTKITPEFLRSEQGMLFLKTMARYETQWEKAYPLTDEQWNTARRIAMEEDFRAKYLGGTVPPAALSNTPSGAAPSTTLPSGAAPSGDARLSAVGNYRSGNDQNRATLLQAAGEASKSLPPGWKVEAYSGQRDQGPHSTGSAVDFRLVDPHGNAIPNYQDPTSYAVYERFAQNTHIALEKINPGLAKQHRWGGYFSGPLGKDASGRDLQYGAMDLMHQDFAGGAGRMAAGNFEQGVSPEWKKRWGLSETAGTVSDAKRTEQTAPTSKYDKPPAWPEHGTEPIQYGGDRKIKIDNNSETDVHVTPPQAELYSAPF